MKVVRLVLGIFFVIGLGLLIGGYFAYQHTRKFLGNAVEADGMVVDIVFSESQGRNGTSASYHPHVRFRTADGRNIDFVSSTGSNPPSYSVNQPVKVLYDPQQPYKAYLNSFGDLWAGTMILGILGVCFTAPATGVFIWQRFSDQKAAWLRQNGRRIQAEIKKVELNRSVTVNGSNPYRIICHWKDPARNEVHVFHSSNIWFDPSDFLEGKTTLDVLMDPAKPHRYLVETSFLPKVV